MTSAKTDTTVVLVHAAWVDGSSWNKVTGELQRKGFKVVAAQIALTSFTDDVAILKKVLLRQKGPVALAGHSYGGPVITAAAARQSQWEGACLRRRSSATPQGQGRQPRTIFADSYCLLVSPHGFRAAIFRP